MSIIIQEIKEDKIKRNKAKRNTMIRNETQQMKYTIKITEIKPIKWNKQHI